MISSSFRGALIGCGFFAENHMHGWSCVPGAKIVALCDTNAERLVAMAKRFGIASTYTDMHAMLAAEKLDFVDVATTASSHRSIIEAVAPHVKLVICQKPFAETMADAEAMVACCASHGTELLIHENFRWQHGFLAVRKLIEEGCIGDLQYARFTFQHGFDNYVNQPYLAKIERLAIMDVGLHLFDLARWLLGEVAQLSCATQHRNPNVRGEDAFTALLAHENGAISVSECSFATVLVPEPFPQTIAVIEGDRGTIELDRDYKLSIHHAGQVETISVEPKVPVWGAKPWHCVQDSVINLQTHARDVLRGRSKPEPSGLDNLKTLTLALAAYESAASGKMIAMANWTEKIA